MADFWRKCNACKKEIGFDTTYYVCSVSTCNRPRTGFVFCTPTCWDSHLGEARHRDAWTTDARSPSRQQWERELAAQDAESKSAPRAGTPAGGVKTAVATASSAPIVRPAATTPAAKPAPSTTTASTPTASTTRPSTTTPSTTTPSTTTTSTTTASTTTPSTTTTSTPAAKPAVTSTPAAGSTTAASTSAPSPTRRVVGDASPATAAAVEGLQLAEVVDRDVLIVVSKMKKYIKDRSGFHCSDAVAEILSDHVRTLCDDAIRAAGRDERKTVLDRDVPRPRR